MNKKIIGIFNAITYCTVLKRIKGNGAEQLLTNCKQLKNGSYKWEKWLTDVSVISIVYQSDEAASLL